MLTALLLLTACGSGAKVEPYFIPPTLQPQVSPVVFNTPTPLAFKSPTPEEPENCTNNLAFVEDVTVEDFSNFSPGEKIEKTWRVSNSGTCNWKEGYTLKIVDGDSFEASPSQPLFPARAGAEVEITVELTAPEQPGEEYLSAWQAYDAEGNAFGAVIYTKFNVVEK